MNWLTWLKLAAVAAAIIFAIHVKGETDAAVLEKDHADLAQATVKALVIRQAQTQAETLRVNEALKKYEDTPLDPVVTGIAQRLYQHTISECPVQAAGGAPGGTGGASRVPGGDPEAERLSQAAFDAGGRDAARLELCKTVWPR